MIARNSGVIMTIDGKDVSKTVAPYLEEFMFSESLEGEADTAEVVLNDSARHWIGDWFPNRGATARVGIFKANWNGEGVDTLDLGSFEIDEITCSYPPSVAKVKFISIPNRSKARYVDKFRSWERTTLKDIAQDLAGDGGFSLFYDADEIEIPRAELSQQSSLAFLKKLCIRNGLILKISDNKVIIVDAEKYEKQPAVRTLSYGIQAVKKFEATASLSQIYGDVNISFKSNSIADYFLKLLGGAGLFNSTAGIIFDGLKGKITGGGKDIALRITQKVSSEAEAKRLAKKLLREKNKHEIKIKMTSVGNFSYLAGNNIELDSSFGFFRGTFMIDKCTHRLGSSGYEVSLEAHRVLEGY